MHDGYRLLIVSLEDTLAMRGTLVPRPEVRARLRDWVEDGGRVVMATNQPQPGLRYRLLCQGLGLQASQFLNWQQLALRLLKVCEGLPVERVFCCLNDGVNEPVDLDGQENRNHQSEGEPGFVLPPPSVPLGWETPAELGLDPKFVISYDRAWRKPSPGMIRAALEWAEVEPDQVLMTAGYRRVNEPAALAAGVDYVALWDFVRGNYRRPSAVAGA